MGREDRNRMPMKELVFSIVVFGEECCVILCCPVLSCAVCGTSATIRKYSA